MTEKGLGGDWEMLRHYLPSKASGGGLGTWQPSCKQPAAETGMTTKEVPPKDFKEGYLAKQSNKLKWNHPCCS